MKINNYLKASVLCGFIALPSTKVLADFLHQDDVIIVGSACIGVDCVNGENFGFDTIRLKENNLRIKFQDTSSSSSFPSRDWEIVANESANGGLNKFSINNVDNQQTPFTILDGVGNDALYIRNTNRVGFGTSTPGLNLHVVDGNSPGLRLEQNGSAGFAAQTWDVAGNETNFFVRDVTNASRIPFKIQPSAPSNSIFVASDGDIGFETSSPDGILDIAHPANLNNHAVLVGSNGNFGMNIDNGFTPRGLLDVQTTGGNSQLLVQSDGKVGIGMGITSVPNGLFDVQTSGQSQFLIDSSGNVGIGTNSPGSKLEINKNVDTLVLGTQNASHLRLTNPSLIETSRILFGLESNGNTGFAIKDTSADGKEYYVTTSQGKFMVWLGNPLRAVFSIDENGNVKARGSITGNTTP